MFLDNSRFFYTEKKKVACKIVKKMLFVLKMRRFEFFLSLDNILRLVQKY